MPRAQVLVTENRTVRSRRLVISDTNMSDTDIFYFRHSYGTWCQICGGNHEDLEYYFLNYKLHYIDPLFSCSLKRSESKNNPYLSLECSQPDILGEMLLDELFQLEDLILNWLKELEIDFNSS